MLNGLKSEHRALIVMISALFFVSLPGAPAGNAGLADALYAEGDWRGARAEAIRRSLADADDTNARLIAALASLRLDPDDATAAATVRQLAEDGVDEDIRARAAYEYGRIRWEAGDPETGYVFLKNAFRYSQNYELFLETAYSLDVLLFRHPDLVPVSDPIRNQLRTVRPLIPLAIRQRAEAPPRARSSLVARAATGPVRFYQSQIGPAIGQRCSMIPSCSAYCMEATHRYGLTGIPMAADRLIRETDHVNYRINPVIVNGQEKYIDPVSDHTGWFRRYR